MFRRFHQRTAILGAIACLAACTPSSPPAPTYKVNLSPAWTAGRKFDYVGDFSTTTRARRATAIPNQLVAEESIEQKQMRRIHLEAAGEALEVFPNGQLKKLSLTVKALEARNEQEALPGFPAPGVTIFIEKTATGDRRITSDGPEISDAAFDLLTPVLWIEDGKYTLQEQFGPAAPVAVNATWPADTQTILEEARKSYETVTSATATMKLDSVAGTGENQVFTVSGEISLQGVKSPLPPPYLGPITYHSTLLLTCPAELRGLFAKKQTVNLSIRGEHTDPASGHKTTLTINADREDTHQITFR